MKSFLILSVFVFSIGSANAECISTSQFSQAPKGELSTFAVSHNRVMAYEAFITNPGEPVLVLMPGVYRGALSSDEVLKDLTSRGVNWISIHLSPQPMSIDRARTATATFGDITTSVLKAEVKSLVQALCVAQPIYVSLSYSGTIGSILNRQDTSLVIDTTPMGTFTDSLPDGGLSYQLMDYWYSFNPILKPGWDTLKEVNYRQFWEGALNEFISRYPAIAASPKLKDVAITGYTSMSKAVENFDIRQTNYHNSPERVFILAEKEDNGRRQAQLQALESARRVFGEQPLTFILLGSHHNVLTEAPVAWAEALEYSMGRKTPQTRIALVSQNGQMQWLTNSQWERVKAQLYVGGL